MSKIGKLMATGLLSLSMVIALLAAMGALNAYAGSAAAGDLTISDEYFPDGNFRLWISQNLDTDKNGTLSEEEVEAVHEIDCTGAQIRDLTGIANFRNLQELRCGGNILTELDLSNNTQLRSVTCTGSQLSSLKLGFLAQLETLYCSNNQLGKLDVSNCPNLKVLQCQENKHLSSLTLGELPDLYEFYCYSVSTDLDLDFTSCPKLGHAFAYGNKTVESTIATYTTDASSEYGTAYLKLNNNKAPLTGIKGVLPDGSVLLEPVNFPDEEFLRLMKGYDKEYNRTDGRLSASERSGITTLQVGYSIENLDGIEYLTDLKQLYHCFGYYPDPPSEDLTMLDHLDLSHNTKLEHIDISFTPKLKELDVSNLTELRALYLYHTGVTSLDVSANTKLVDCRCYDSYYGNDLTSIKFGNNPELEEIEVQENKLTSLDLSGLSSLKVVYCNENQLKSLNLKGCTSLEQINCHMNELTELDLDGMTSLKILDCYYNQLTELDLSDCDLMERFSCGYNHLTELDLKDMTELQSLTCENNQIRELDLSGFTKLDLLFCNDNKLVKLGIKGCSALDRFTCQRNQLTSLDISGCSVLRECLCSENKIATLDVSESPTMLRLVKEGERGTSTETIRYSGDFDGLRYELLIDNFTVIPGSPTPDPKPKKTISDGALSYYSCNYTGKAMKPSAIMIVVNGTPSMLTEGKDYTITYKNNKNVGKATVTIKGTGNYTGTFTKTFQIDPKGTKLSKVTKAKKAATVKWKKQSLKMSTSRITGYQIQLATNSKFTKNAKLVTVKGYSKTSKKVTGLKGGKKYYVRIRTYKTVGGKKYVSTWSKVLTVKTKK